jgi:hypothetical protein
MPGCAATKTCADPVPINSTGANSMPRTKLLLLACLLAGCTLLTKQALNERYGTPDPTRFDIPAQPSQGIFYRAEIQPILERRCVVCHGCYDAPCQLKLSAWEGITRGATKQKVYDAARLLEAAPSRLFIDAQMASQWRARDFHPVLNEREQAPEANLTGSLLYRMLELKRSHPQPDGGVLPQADFDFSLDRKQQCASIEEFDAFERNYPQWGMPYGLPGLSRAEQATLERWLVQGAPYAGPEPLPAAVTQQLRDWEHFLNGDSLKMQLTSRYLYEHLFLAHLYFDSDPDSHYFRLVRSASPPGEPVREIASRRPYDDPGVERVYYRLAPVRETLLAKTHMPYALGPVRMARWRALFLASDYSVATLPSYEPAIAANPFIAFQALPPQVRYRFMLDEAQFTIMGFIKGPVCRGQIALNVIEDRFWVFFVNPDAFDSRIDAGFLAQQSENLSLPSEKGSNALILATWVEYSQRENDYLKAKSEYMKQRLNAPSQVTLDLVWDGDGKNPNAALTVFRHFNSASVVQGLVGKPPKTAWVIGYPLLERIHYLLVAGYDVYGNAGHQLNSRLYMDFLRMEGEFNFLALLPAGQRDKVRDFWYRDTGQAVKDYLYGSRAWFDRDSGIDYHSDDPQRELYGLLQARLAPVLGDNFDLATVRDPALRAELQQLAALQGASLSLLPEAMFLRLEEPDGRSRYFTLLRNTGHANVTNLANEQKELLPDENTLTVVPGFIGAYPNVLYVVTRDTLPGFIASVRALASEADYRALADRFAIRRTNPRFWTYSDALQDAYARLAPVESALFDYNRLENR